MTEPLDARSEILVRIRSAIGTDRLPENVEDAWQAIPRNYRQSGALAPAVCIELLEERLRDYGAGVHRCESAQITATVADIVRRRNKKRMLISPDIDPMWLPHMECAFLRDGMMSYDDMDNCDGVMTGTAVAIAATGTLGLCHGSRGNRTGQGRRATTLIPDYHLCVVRALDVVETVPEAMRVLDQYKEQPITFISGPSATADIEMTRIQGVHGPRTLDVVIMV